MTQVLRFPWHFAENQQSAARMADEGDMRSKPWMAVVAGCVTLA
jgi:hypothetical protein